MAYLVLTAMLLWTAASALALCPGMGGRAGAAAVLAAVFTAVSAVVWLLARGEMFSDITEAVIREGSAAVGCAAISAAVGCVLGKWLEKREKGRGSDEKEKVNEQS